MPPTKDCDSGQCPPSEDPMDASTFTPPAHAHEGPAIVIEFCNRCRWLHRATWVQTELFLTFPDVPPSVSVGEGAEEQDQGAGGGKYATAGKGIRAITLVPCNSPESGGRFRVWLYKEVNEDAQTSSKDGGGVVLLWDRKIRGGFPELKELKQVIRDEIAPAHKLGHSDRKTVQGGPAETA